MCKSNQYQIGNGPQSYLDRQCLNYTVCTASQFISVSPTFSSNLQCSNFSVCTPFILFESVAPTSTTDRKCRNCSNPSECGCKNCSSFQYIVTNCTSPILNDTLCANCSTCNSSISYRSATCTTITDTLCIPISTCPITQFKVANASLTSGRLYS